MSGFKIPNCAMPETPVAPVAEPHFPGCAAPMLVTIALITSPARIAEAAQRAGKLLSSMAGVGVT